MKFKKYVDQLHKDGLSASRYSVVFWQKISISISCVIFSIIGVLGLNKSNKRSQSLGSSIGLTLVVVILYWFLESFLLELGKSAKINVFLAAFGAMLLFVAVILISKFKEITSRF